MGRKRKLPKIPCEACKGRYAYCFLHGGLSIVAEVADRKTAPINNNWRKQYGS